MPAFRLVPQDVLINYRFHVEVQGIVSAYFTECDGLSLEREIVEYKEGGTNDYVYQFSGRVSQQKVRLRRGLGYDDDLWAWFRRGILTGKVLRKNVTIHVKNPERKTVQRWELLSAFPAKYEGPDLKSEQAVAALELLELAHHGLIFTAVDPPE
jgi:phage tail-like protein